MSNPRMLSRTAPIDLRSHALKCHNQLLKYWEKPVTDVQHALLTKIPPEDALPFALDIAEQKLIELFRRQFGELCQASLSLEVTSSLRSLVDTVISQNLSALTESVTYEIIDPNPPPPSDSDSSSSSSSDPSSPVSFADDSAIPQSSSSSAASAKLGDSPRSISSPRLPSEATLHAMSSLASSSSPTPAPATPIITPPTPVEKEDTEEASSASPSSSVHKRRKSSSSTSLSGKSKSKSKSSSEKKLKDHLKDSDDSSSSTSSPLLSVPSLSLDGEKKSSDKEKKKKSSSLEKKRRKKSVDSTTDDTLAPPSPSSSSSSSSHKKKKRSDDSSSSSSSHKKKKRSDDSSSPADSGPPSPSSSSDGSAKKTKETVAESTPEPTPNGTASSSESTSTTTETSTTDSSSSSSSGEGGERPSLATSSQSTSSLGEGRRRVRRPPPEKKAPPVIVMKSVTNDMVDMQQLQKLVEETVNNHYASLRDALAKASTVRDPQLDVYFLSVIGPRQANEDEICIVRHVNEWFNLPDGKTSSKYSFFAVYDGHNGHHAAKFSRRYLHRNVLVHDGFDSDLKQAIEDSFHKTDELVNHIQESAKHQSCGTTALTMWVRDNKELIVGNAGDCQGFIKRADQVVQLAPIHSPSGESERARIKASGGAVVCFGTWRVNGVLAVSRSIGDFTLKNLVIATPDVLRYDLNDEDEWAILASDGLWDVTKPHELPDLVNEGLAKGGREYVCKHLCDTALLRNSKDNVSVVVIFFRPDPNPPIPLATLSAASASLPSPLTSTPSLSALLSASASSPTGLPVPLSSSSSSTVLPVSGPPDLSSLSSSASSPLLPGIPSSSSSSSASSSSSLSTETTAADVKQDPPSDE
eukprot:TRINITY_DN552_c6_g1_i2.p1 TRINITY_DN552_c6_g1~~TRINITY_DN552_c6_g1_i2.p1  ORF type:complete len:865 (-),score=425.80 TRINITY_DN552_c6_g1_i2:154-2748(-)